MLTRAQARSRKQEKVYQSFFTTPTPSTPLVPALTTPLLNRLSALNYFAPQLQNLAPQVLPEDLISSFTDTLSSLKKNMWRKFLTAGAGVSMTLKIKKMIDQYGTVPTLVAVVLGITLFKFARGRLVKKLVKDLRGSEAGSMKRGVLSSGLYFYDAYKEYFGAYEDVLLSS